MSQRKFIYQQNLSLQLRKSWSKWSQQKFVRQLKNFVAIDAFCDGVLVSIFYQQKTSLQLRKWLQNLS